MSDLERNIRIRLRKGYDDGLEMRAKNWAIAAPVLLLLVLWPTLPIMTASIIYLLSVMYWNIAKNSKWKNNYSYYLLTLLAVSIVVSWFYPYPSNHLTERIRSVIDYVTFK
jgi:hypothetical protein